MRKLLISIFVLLAAGVASAQTEREETEVVTNSSGYKLLRTRGHNWLWGFGATTPPSTFNSENIPQGAAWLNTSTGLVSIYGPSGWTSAAGGAASSVAFADVTTGTNTVTLEMSGQTNISGPDAATNVEIGSVTNNANAGTGGSSIAIGGGANISNTLAGIVIGGFNSTPTTITSSAATSSIAIGIGTSVTATGVQNVAIGPGSIVSGSSVTNALALGITATTSTSGSVAIGNNPTASGTSSIAIGNNATANGGANSITMGQNVTGAANAITLSAGGTLTGATNSFVAAYPTAGLSHVYFGRGVTSTTADAYTIHGTGGSGADNAGGALKLAGGFGTGTAAGGDLALQRSPSIATSSTLQTATDAYYIRSQKKDLSDGVATAFARISIPQGVAGLTGWTGGTAFYTILANDATNYQARSGSINFAFVNEAGTEACTLGTASSEADNTPTGTLTVTVTAASNASDTCDLLANAASSLTESTLAMFYSIVLNGPGTVTPQ